MIVLMDNYDSFTYNLYQLVAQVYPHIKVIRNDECTLKELQALKPKAFLLSPGPKRPEDAQNLIPLIQQETQIPILGVCLGMQAMAQAFGGKIVHAKQCMHGKSDFIEHQQSSIFHKIPQSFKAARYHSLAVEAKSLPKNLEVIAKSGDQEVMAIKHRTLRCYGVQFHPESILSEYGSRLIKNFLKIADVL